MTIFSLYNKQNQQNNEELEEELIEEGTKLQKETFNEIQEITYDNDVKLLKNEIVLIEELEESKFMEYSVRIIPRVVKYFAGPGWEYAVLGRAKRNKVYMIIEEKKNLDGCRWGRMKSCLGWLPLKSCKLIGN